MHEEAQPSACVLCTPIDYAGLGLTRLTQVCGFTVVRVHDPRLPAWIRVISTRHVTEIGALSRVERAQMWQILTCIEACMQKVLQPSKINWASLGNMVPHLHWHLIARFSDDAMWPASPWSAPERSVNTASLAAVQAKLPALEAAILAALAELAASETLELESSN